MHSVSDEQYLIEALKAKDESAFKRLVEDYKQNIFSTCLGIVHDANDADDVTQDVLIEAFYKIHKFRSDAKLSTWLYRIAINKSLNFIRDKKRNQVLQRIGILEENNIINEDDNISDKEADREALSKAIHTAIDSLPSKQRTAFVLCKYDLLSYKEIAEVMDLSVASVESLLFRAKKSLAKKLNPYKSRGSYYLFFILY